MPEIHLKQPGFIYSACGTFTKSKKRVQKFKETEDAKYIYRNERDKTCFQHDMAFGDFTDLARRTASDKFLRDKAFDIAKNLEYDGYKRALASMVYKFFDKKAASSGVATLGNKSAFNNEELAGELHKPIIKFQKKNSLFWVQRQYIGCLFSWYAINKQV